MEDTELGCNSKAECVNYPDKCQECSAHYSCEYSDTEKIDEEE